MLGMEGEQPLLAAATLEIGLAGSQTRALGAAAEPRAGWPRGAGVLPSPPPLSSSSQLSQFSLLKLRYFHPEGAGGMLVDTVPFGSGGSGLGGRTLDLHSREGEKLLVPLAAPRKTGEGWIPPGFWGVLGVFCAGGGPGSFPVLAQ